MASLNLNKYASLAEYYADTRPVGEHNVSYIGNEYVVYEDEEMYDMQGNKIINWQNYLNFYMPNGGTVSLNKTGSPTVVELEYSIDKGQTWTVWAEDGGGNRSLTLTAGQRVYVRNTSETQTGFSTGGGNYYKFSFVGSVGASGNCNSLICKIPNIVTTLSASSYIYMFQDCTSLTLSDGFTLPATTLAGYCYSYMFYGCTSVNKVRTLMTNISAIDCLTNWLHNTAAQGDFYCPAELTIPTGSSGIPSGWTRHDI